MSDAKDARGYTQAELDNMAVMRRYYSEAWNGHREEIFKSLVSPDIVAHYEHEVLIGIDEWKNSIYHSFAQAIPDGKLQVDDMTAHGDRVVIRWTVQGVFRNSLLGVPPTGKAFEFSGISWTRFENGRIAEIWTNWNMSYLFRRLLKEVETLRACLPICSYCKNVRDDDGYWKRVEEYLKKYSHTTVSHGICPTCLKDHYPEEYQHIYGEADQESNDVR